MDATQFVLGKLKTTGIETQAELAKSLGIPATSWRTNVSRGIISAEIGQKLATILNTEESEIWKHFKKARYKKPAKNTTRHESFRQDIIPLIKKIAGSKIKAMNLEELHYLADLEGSAHLKPSTLQDIIEGRRKI